MSLCIFFRALLLVIVDVVVLFLAWAVVCCAVSGFRVFLLLSHWLGWFGMFVYLTIQCSSCSLFGFFVV